MKNVCPSWFVRQSVIDTLEESVIDIASFVLDTEIEWYGEDDESAEELAGCILKYMDLSEMTEDEVYYVLQHISFYCGMGYLYRMGKLTDDQASKLEIPERLKTSGLEA